MQNYTVEAANRTLPYVSAIVAEVRERYTVLRDKGNDHNETPRTETKARKTLKEEIRENAARLKECQEELLAIGLQLKDYESGLVDFPAELDGRPILLCWQFGEASVEHWHETDEGYPGRRKIPADVPAWPEATAAASQA